MMLHTRSPMLEKLAIAAQLTPPPSPDNQLKPIEEWKGSSKLNALELPHFLYLPDAVDSHYSAYASNGAESYISTADNPVSIVEPVSPLSSTYSDRGTSFDVSRPGSFLPNSTSTCSGPHDRVSASIQSDYLLIGANEVTPSAPGELAQRSNINQSVSLPKANKTRHYKKELLPPPSADISNKDLQKALPSSQTQSEEYLQSNLGHRPDLDRDSPAVERGERHTPPRPISKVLDDASILHSRRTVIPNPSPVSRAFPSVATSLHRVQPTYTVTVTAPKLTRRFSKLSTKSKESSDTINPLSPVETIPQKSNGVETGAIAYLPRYTNTFAGFCKNAWRLQINEVDKALNVRNRNSSTVAPSFKCEKCSFEGPLQPLPASNNCSSTYRKIPDSRIRTSYGISYNWQFLFKSHVARKKKTQKEFELDMSETLFGCIFCCVRGKGTPVFKGPEALMWHMRAHAGEGNAIDRELEMRFKIIIGRRLEEGDIFDIYIPPLQSPTAGDQAS